MHFDEICKILDPEIDFKLIPNIKVMSKCADGRAVWGWQILPCNLQSTELDENVKVAQETARVLVPVLLRYLRQQLPNLLDVSTHLKTTQLSINNDYSTLIHYWYIQSLFTHPMAKGLG